MSCQSYNPLQFHMDLSSSHQPSWQRMPGWLLLWTTDRTASFGNQNNKVKKSFGETYSSKCMMMLLRTSCAADTCCPKTLCIEWIKRKKELISKTNTDGNTMDRLTDRRSHLVTTFVECQGTHIWVSDTETSNWHECLDHGENCAIIATIDNIQNTKTTSTIQFNFSPATGRWPAMQAARQTDRQMCKSGAVRFRSFQKSIPSHTDNRRQLQFPA